jgi:DNA-binding XRE family transcriptional regulator
MTDDERLSIALNFLVDNMPVSDARNWVRGNLYAHCKQYPRCAEQMIQEYARDIGFVSKNPARLGLPWAEWRETYGAKMRSYRGKFKMNQKDFGYIVGLNQGRVSRYERGVAPVPEEVQIRIERAVELLSGEA